ncbi:hypothetical protein FOZ63_016251, partial [Perkinsus olseni]
VMATVNDPNKRFVNGLTGRVANIIDPTGADPVIIVQFDDDTPEVPIHRAEFSVYASDDTRVFTRKQFPLIVSRALTCHKTQGCTLDGVWAKLPFARVPKSSNPKIEQFWKKDWLAGAAYTLMSRVGSRDKIRIHPLRRVKAAEDLGPMFFMNPEAQEFDKTCLRDNWLRSAAPTEFRDQEESYSRHSDEEARPAQEAGPLASTASFPLQLVERMGEDLKNSILERIDENDSRWMMLQHFEANRPSTGSGEAFTNPVFYAWMNPRLREK